MKQGSNTQSEGIGTLSQTFRKSLIKNSNKMENWENIERSAEF
ncbi:hypothetical protein C5S32_07950 [ANME-1 cluster archaeon GoMg1]|nr:hypothetical protein [ANME-1 cluster archaeon GoMg1]